MGSSPITDNWSRRSFLEASLAAATLPRIPAPLPGPPTRKNLPPIPSVPATAKGLYALDSSPPVSAWVKNLAKAANQGPIGQAHFVETVFPLEHGAAYKCPNDPPYINDWCCIAGGGFTDLMIVTIFGADSTLFDGIKAQPRLTDFDRKARLVNLRYQAKRYTITEKGATVIG
jgi:hypothetical protein